MNFSKSDYDFLPWLLSVSPELHESVKSAALVGSTYIYGQGVDIDVLVLVDSEHLISSWQHPEWKYGGSTPKSGDGWGSWKKGEVNLLLTHSEDYFNKWLTAADVCKYLFHKRSIVLSKEERIAVHAMIMDGKEFCDYVDNDLGH